MPQRVRNRNGREGYLTNDGTFIEDANAKPDVSDFNAIEAAGINSISRMRGTMDRVRALTGNTDAQTRVDEQDAFLSTITEEFPIASAIGTALQPTTLIPGGKLTQMGIGAAEGALDDPDNPLPGVIGGATGALLGDVLGRQVAKKTATFMNKFDTGVSTAAIQRQAARRLTAQGVPLSRTQRNAAGAKSIEGGLDSLPFISQISQYPLRKQQDILNQTAARAFGLKTENLGPGVLKLIKDNIQSKFKLVESSIPTGRLPSNVIDQVEGLNILSSKGKQLLDVTGPLDGAQTLRVRSALNSRVADLAMKGEVPEANALRATLNELDTFIDDGIKFTRPNGYPAVLGALDDARAEWKLLTALRHGNSVTQGKINPISLNKTLNNMYPNFDVGRELPGKAKALGAMLQDMDVLQRPFNDSGTPGRQLAAGMLMGTTAMPSSGASLVVPAIVAEWAAAQPGEAIGGVVGRSAGREAGQEIDEQLIQ